MSHMATAESSGLLSCHSQASVVLCAALMPECQADGTGLTVCQAMCFEVSTACTALFEQLSLALDCRSYPLSLDASSVLCQTGENKLALNGRSSLLKLMAVKLLEAFDCINCLEKLFTLKQCGYVRLYKFVCP